MFNKNFLKIILILSLVFPVFAQYEPIIREEKEERKKLILEQIISDIKNLKLADNKALIYTKVGSRLWRSDKERAVNYYKQAINELIKAQNEAENHVQNNDYKYLINNLSNLLSGTGIRHKIIQEISHRDANLALEFLVLSRPKRNQKALATKSPKYYIDNVLYVQSGLVMSERNVERRLKMMKAEQQPKVADQILSQMLKEDITYDTLRILKKLHKANPDSANKFANKMIDDLLNSKLQEESASQNSYTKLYLMYQFLHYYLEKPKPNESKLILDKDKMEKLADKLTLFLSEHNGNRQLSSLSNQTIPIAEKFFPSRVKSLKQNPPRRRFGNFLNPKDSKEANELLQSNLPPEDLIKKSNKFSTQSRHRIILEATKKIETKEGYEKAKETLVKHISKDEVQSFLASFHWQLITFSISKRDFKKAEKYIEMLPERMKTERLMSLAESIPANESNKDYLKQLLNKVTKLNPIKTTDSREMSHRLKALMILTQIDSNEAFRLFAPLKTQIEDLLNASAKLNSFQRRHPMRQNEFILSNNSPWGIYIYNVHNLMKHFVKADFERTIELINNFERAEFRIKLKLDAYDGI